MAREGCPLGVPFLPPGAPCPLQLWPLARGSGWAGEAEEGGLLTLDPRVPNCNPLPTCCSPDFCQASDASNSPPPLEAWWGVLEGPPDTGRQAGNPAVPAGGSGGGAWKPQAASPPQPFPAPPGGSQILADGRTESAETSLQKRKVELKKKFKLSNILGRAGEEGGAAADLAPSALCC